MASSSVRCEFCETPGGPVLWRNRLCRVVRADEPHYPGFCRVILERHAREMTDLDAGERSALMDVVFAVETAVRQVMQPHKMNIASLGNQVPHVHWHVIPRFDDDRHYPFPVWAAPQRESTPRADREARAGEIASAIAALLGATT